MEAVGRKNHVDKNHLIASGMESTSCGKQAEHFNILARVRYVTVKGGRCIVSYGSNGRIKRKEPRILQLLRE